MYQRALVTGSSGVLGHAFQAIAGEYPHVQFVFARSTDCDLRDAAATARYVREVAPDAIVHAAAVTGGVGFAKKYPATMLRDNVLMGFNVLDAARDNGVKKVVLTLGTVMYPTDAPRPIKEEYLHLGPAHDANYGYSYAKRLMEPAIRAYRTEFSLNAIGLASNGIFGEHDKFTHEGSVMLAALIRRFYENRDNSDELVVWGDGSPLREYTYSLDMARAHMWCLEHYDDAQILNVGTTEEHSVREFAGMVAEIIGVDAARIKFDATKPSGVGRISTDNSKFVKLSGFQYTPTRVGLERTIRWFMDNYDQPGKVRL
jgi:GDP-L-fucose synthase